MVSKEVEKLLLKVQKPGRYVGGELNAVVKNKKEEIVELKELNLNNEKTLELKDIFSLAINNNLDIQQNKNSSKIDKLNIEDAKSDYKPQIDFY